MFNEYQVIELIKLRQRETERNVKDAWMKFSKSNEKIAVKKETFSPGLQVNPCCQCG
jgi:hypothetical protein